MSQQFSKGAMVLYRTPRGGQEGIGTVVDIHQTERGLWYEVKDRNTGAVVRLRFSSMELA